LRKKRKSPLIRKQRGRESSGRPRMVVFFFLASVGMIVLYLWGRVQIDFVIRDNDRLGGECQRLQYVVDDLRVEVSALKGYARIVGRAKERGMVFVSAARIRELPVDLEGIGPAPEVGGLTVQYAGFDFRGWLPQPRKHSSHPLGID